MDSSNWRPAQPEPAMEGSAGEGDWRSQLPPDLRQRIVNKIMETMKQHHLPCSGQDGLQELKKKAIRFEEKIYSAATSQSDYLRKISLKMFTMESKYQNPLPNALPANSSPSLDSTAQTSGTVDCQEEVYQKIKTMKDKYYEDLNEFYLKISMKLQQPKMVNIEKLRSFKMSLERMMHFLQLTKSSNLSSNMDKLALIEKQIVNFLSSNRPRRPMSSLQQGQLPPPHQSMQHMQQPHTQTSQAQSHGNWVEFPSAVVEFAESLGFPAEQCVKLTAGFCFCNYLLTAEHDQFIAAPGRLDPGQGNAMGSK